MKVKLSEAFDLQMGKTPSRNNSSYWGPGYKWVSIADMGGSEKYISKTKETITGIAVSESGIKVVPQNTVIMSFKLSIGKTAITHENMYTNEAIMAFLDKGTYNIDTDYFYHLCKGVDWVTGTNKAVLGLTLNKATMSEKEIEIPPVEEQREAVAVLDKVDELISLRKQQLTKLDELVKARFVELFGATSADKCSKRIKDYAEVLGGYAFKSELFCFNAVPVIRISNINNGCVELDYNICFDELFWAQNKRFRAEQNDILMAMSGATTGKAGIYREDIPALINQRVACIRAKEGIAYPTFLFVATQLEWMYDLIQETSAGCAQPNISGKQIENMPVPDATYEQQQQFAAFVEQTDKSKLAIQQSLDKLETLKKSLMQKYFG